MATMFRKLEDWEGTCSPMDLPEPFFSIKQVAMLSIKTTTLGIPHTVIIPNSLRTFGVGEPVVDTVEQMRLSYYKWLFKAETWYWVSY